MNSALLLFTLCSSAAPEGVTIERATISWNELERLLKKEGAAAPKPGPAAPLAHSISKLEVEGTLSPDRAELSAIFEIEILSKAWTIVPLIPEQFAVAAAEVSAADHLRGILVRDSNGVSLVAKGEGHYRVDAKLERTLTPTSGEVRLQLSPPKLTAGFASITVFADGEVSGRTKWRNSKPQVYESALGSTGVDLVFRPSNKTTTNREAAALEDLRAVTIVSLGGRGTTKLSLLATPGEGKIFEAILPESARLFRIALDKETIPTERARSGNTVRIALDKKTRVELAYTFDTEKMGMKGRWHLELPKLSGEAQGALWDIWLPPGLEYSSGQSSLARSSCSIGHIDPLYRSMTVDTSGSCFGFAMPVLALGTPYAEGAYRQRF